MFGLVVWIGALLKELNIRVFGRYLDKEYSFRRSFCSIYHADNPDLVPIIMRSKELELYRNGCTYRIRAPERNLPNGELPHKNMADQYSLIKNESIIEANGKGEGLHIIPFFKAKNMDRIKNLVELEDEKKLNGNSNEDQPVNVIWRLQRRRIRYGIGKTMVEYFGHQLSSFDSTINERVQSYGSRYAKSPIIYGVVSRPKALIVLWFSMVQSMTKHSTKEMLTEPGHHFLNTHQFVIYFYLPHLLPVTHSCTQESCSHHHTHVLTTHLILHKPPCVLPFL